MANEQLEAKNVIKQRLDEWGIKQGTYMLFGTQDEVFLKEYSDDTVYSLSALFSANQTLLDKYGESMRWGHNNGLDAVYFKEGFYLISRHPQVAEVMQKMGVPETGLGVILSNGEKFVYADGRPDEYLNAEWHFVKAYGDKIRKDREAQRVLQAEESVKAKLADLGIEEGTYLLFGPKDNNVCIQDMVGGVRFITDMTMQIERMQKEGRDMVWNYNGGVVAACFSDGFYFMSPDVKLMEKLRQENIPSDSRLFVELSNGGQFVFEDGRPNKWFNHKWQEAKDIVKKRETERHTVTCYDKGFSHDVSPLALRCKSAGKD